MNADVIGGIKKHKTIVSNTFYLSVINVVRLLTPFVALPYVIRVIGAERFGEIAFAQSIAAFSFILINFGLDVSAVKDVSQNREDKKMLSHIVSSVLSLKFLLFIVTGLLYGMMVMLVPMFRNNYLLFLIAFGSAINEVIFPTWYFQGVERMKYLTLTNFVSVLFYLSTLFIFVRTVDDYLFVPLLQLGGTILSGVIGLCLLLVKEKISLQFPSVRQIKRTFKDGAPFFLSRVSVVVNQNIAKVVSGVFLGMTEVAAFELAQKMIGIALMPFHMFIQAVYPHNANKRDRNFARKVFYLMLLMAVVISIGVYVIAPFAVQFFAGSDGVVDLAVSTLRWLLGFLLFGSVGMYVGSPTLVAWGYSKPFNQSVYISTLTLLGIYGVLYMSGMLRIEFFALSLMVVEMVIFSYRYYFCRKYRIL